MTAQHRSKISQYNLGRKELEAFFGPLEANIIETVWNSEKKPLTVRKVYEKLKREKSIAYTTVMSTMDRLYVKGLLDRQIEKGKGGLFYVYWPKLEEQSFKKSAVRQVISSLIENFGEVVTSYLIEEAASDKQESRALREQLDNIMKEKKK
jgi:predicted transcriptional regulator